MAVKQEVGDRSHPKEAVLLEETSRKVARNWFKERKVALIPVGSTEQHGPHLSLEKAKDVETGLELKSEASYENTLNVAEELVTGGSDAILLACTGFSAIAPKIAKAMDAPVIDPVVAAGAVAHSLMVNRKG